MDKFDCIYFKISKFLKKKTKRVSPWGVKKVGGSTSVLFLGPAAHVRDRPSHK